MSMQGSRRPRQETRSALPRALPGMSRQAHSFLPLLRQTGTVPVMSSICSASALVHQVPTRLGRCAAGRFVASLDREDLLARTTRVRSELFGSLGATGHGHGSYNAVLWGLEGEDPETVDTSSGPVRADEIRRTGELRLNGTHPVAFDPENDLILYRRRSLPFHPNGMTFTAYYDGKVLSERTYYSIGGGFVLMMTSPTPPATPGSDAGAVSIPHRQRAAGLLQPGRFEHPSAK